MAGELEALLDAIEGNLCELQTWHNEDLLSADELIEHVGSTVGQLKGSWPNMRCSMAEVKPVLLRLKRWNEAGLISEVQWTQMKSDVIGRTCVVGSSEAGACYECRHVHLCACMVCPLIYPMRHICHRCMHDKCTK